MPEFAYRVIVECDTQGEANRVMSERLLPCADYGFGYRMDWEELEVIEQEPEMPKPRFAEYHSNEEADALTREFISTVYKPTTEPLGFCDEESHMWDHCMYASCIDWAPLDPPTI